MATLKPTLRREALQLVFWQLVVTLLLTLIITFVEGVSKGLSTFLGGSTYILPQFIFAWRVFSYARLQQAGQFMVAFFLGEFAKLVLSAILFILIVNHLSVIPVFAITGYIFAIISFWLVCGWHFGRIKKVSNSRVSS